MHLSKISLKNIRGVGDTPLIVDFSRGARLRRERPHPLAGWNVIVGPNGAGKSALLQVMAASLVGPTGSFWLLRPDNLPDWIHRRGFDAQPGDKGTTSAWVQCVLEDDGASTSDETDKPIPLKVQWSRSAGGARTVFPRGNHNFVSTQFWDAAAQGVKPDGWLFAGYGPWRVALRSSSDAASLLKAAPRLASVVTLFRDDAALEEGPCWLVRLELGRTKAERDEELVDGVLRFLGDGLILPGVRSLFHVAEDGLWVFLNETDQKPVRLLGDGCRVLLALVLDILYQVERFKPGRLREEIRRWSKDKAQPISVQMSGVIVIDEPENHLHPAVQRRLGFWLKEHFPNMQFIVATHSALICQAADRGGLFRLLGPDRCNVVDEEVWKAVTNGTINDALTTELFGFSTPYAPRGEELRKELMRMDAAILAGDHSTRTLQRRAELLARLPKPVAPEVAAALRLALSRG